MSKIFWCKSCSAERSCEPNPDGYYTIPETWFHVFLHEVGRRRIVANACSEPCLIAILQDMPVGNHLTAPNGIGRERVCRTCKDHYRADEIRPGSISIATYNPVGRRTFCGPFCGPGCAAEYYQDELTDLLEAA
jgi:hypothetical protein